MRKLLMVGCGDMGVCLAGMLAGQADIYGLRRNVSILPKTVKPIAADVTDPDSLRGLCDIAFDTVVITLTPGQASDQRYQQVYVEGTRNLLTALDKVALKRLLFVSSTSVYGQQNDEWVDESSATEPQRYSGKRLLEAEQVCHQFAKQHGAASSVIRFAGIYGPGRLRLINDVLAGKGSAPVYSNRIHRDDCVGVLKHLFTLPLELLQPCYIGVDDLPVKSNQVKDWLAEQLACQKPVPIAASNTGAKRCSNRLLKESGYPFIYDNYQEGYANILSEINDTQHHSK
ncbi:MAG: nucleoside-diphosphate-sugar epimerase [Pseudohongiellaceae bacterium]|jgi:nucleoside-diphosphate-sugar epimerase